MMERAELILAVIGAAVVGFALLIVLIVLYDGVAAVWEMGWERFKRRFE